MKVIHSWLKEYIGDSLPEPKVVEELLTFHAFEVDGVEELVGEVIIDIDVLPNRSSDCLSHRGIARELSSILKTPLAKDPFRDPVTLPKGSKITLHIEDENLCNRFTAAVITGVKVAPSPDWLKQKLEALGQRSINNIVDATNYVMFAIGQPTHAFDFDKLAKDSEGHANITIRNGKEGETLILLTGEEINSDETVLHLVDGNNDALLDLAGIKGGAAAELTNDTTNIVVTSGNFNYQSVRKTSQKLKVFTDASQRFQNEPSAELAGYGLQETVKLILELAGGVSDGIVELYPVKPQSTSVNVGLEKTNALLGLTLHKAGVQEILERVSETVEETVSGFVATAPWERTDLLIEEDYIEEIGRLHGLSNIESIVPKPVEKIEMNSRQFYSEKIRQSLLVLGFSEVITSSFWKKGKIQLQNALASDKSYLRFNLTKNITDVLDKNYTHIDLLNIDAVRVFEIGTVFEKTEDDVTEHVSLALGVRTKGNGFSQQDEKMLLEATQSLEEVFGTKFKWDIDKGVAEVNVTELIEALPVPEKYEEYQKPSPITYRPISMYPATSRDIALWVEEGTTEAEVGAVLRENAGELCVKVSLFDTFSKEGKTSYAFRLVFLSFERTLTDSEVTKEMERVYASVVEKNWEVR